MSRCLKAVCAHVLALCVATPSAMALCMDGRAPTAAQEAAHATTVVQARVMRARELHEDASDPTSITAKRYTVRVLRTLRGRAPRALTLYSENTSARFFPMEAGEHYLQFMSRDASGRYFIDACGNSAALPEAQATLKALAARRGKDLP